MAFREQLVHNRRIVRQGRVRAGEKRWLRLQKARSLSGLVGGIPLLVIAIVGSGVLGTLPDPEIRPLAIVPLAIFLPLALLCFFSGVIAIVGGIAAFNRRKWGLAVAGSIAAVIGFFPVGIAAVIFTILAEPEFHPSA